MGYVTSKMAAPVRYAFYTMGANKINVVTDEITVNGGADVINKKSLETPSGVVTELPDDKIEKLMTHPLFKTHLKNGFVSVLATEKEAKKADRGLEEDKSSQIKPKDYEKGNKKKEIRANNKKPTTKKD